MKSLKFKRIFAGSILVSFVLSFFGFFVFALFEPEIISAATDSDQIIVTAVVTGELSITPASDLQLSPSIPGTTGNSGSPASGSVTWTVITSEEGGFNMKIKASTNPAMKLDDTYNFSDYANQTPLDYDWNDTPISSGAAAFGFTVEPATASDTVTNFLDSGAVTQTCGTGSTNGTNTCWAGLSTTDTDVILRSSSTDSDGENEVVKFRAESNAKYLESGNYQATVTATVSSN